MTIEERGFTPEQVVCLTQLDSIAKRLKQVEIRRDVAHDTYISIKDADNATQIIELKPPLIFTLHRLKQVKVADSLSLGCETEAFQIITYHNG